VVERVGLCDDEDTLECVVLRDDDDVASLVDCVGFGDDGSLV
jgi:hypothetical protein